MQRGLDLVLLVQARRKSLAWGDVEFKFRRQRDLHVFVQSVQNVQVEYQSEFAGLSCKLAIVFLVFSSGDYNYRIEVAAGKVGCNISFGRKLTLTIAGRITAV